MPTIDTLNALLKHELKDLYSAETQIIEALPEIIDAVSTPELKKALQQHLAVTKTQKKRLDEVQKLLGEQNTPAQPKGFFANLFKSNEGGQHCKAMEGLVKEGSTLLKEDMTPEVMDAAIIAAAQKIEHYEISSYGTARAFALQLQLHKVADLLKQTLNEEYEADDSLTALALSKVNLEAEDETESLSNRPESKKPVAKAAKKAPSKSSKAKGATSKKAKVVSLKKVAASKKPVSKTKKGKNK